MGFIKGEDRQQITMFPEAVDDYISGENPVRFIDEFVGRLDLEKLGIKRAEAKELGRPAYDPADLLRLYVYGYLNRVRSSRLLERETKRNLEVIWLLRKLTPDHKTIARFRADNSKGLRAVWLEFTVLCKQLKLFGGELVGIDGSKFRAVNSKKNNYTRKKIENLIKWADTKIDNYIRELDERDKQEEGIEDPTAEELNEKIKRLRERKEGFEAQKTAMEESGEQQLSAIDAESRLMKTADGGMNVCYNVQIAVDSKHRLIVEHEVTNEINDQGLLAKIAKAAKENLGVEELDVVADRGYYSGAEVRECEKSGIEAYIEKPVVRSKDGFFTKDQFSYDKEQNVYVCPAGEKLQVWRKSRRRNRTEYRSKACRKCRLRDQCTQSKRGRAIYRTAENESLDQMAERVRGAPQKVELRRTLVEHPFGTIKRWGQGHFLMKGKEKSQGEMSLIAIAYNLKRVLTIVGVDRLLQALAPSS
jgi:transposase